MIKIEKRTVIGPFLYFLLFMPAYSGYRLLCSRTIEKYQYGCTFSRKKYSHTGILSSQKFCHTWNILRDNYF